MSIENLIERLNTNLEALIEIETKRVNALTEVAAKHAGSTATVADASTAEAPKATRKKAAPPKEVVVEPEAEVEEEVVEETVAAKDAKPTITREDLKALIVKVRGPESNEAFYKQSAITIRKIFEKYVEEGETKFSSNTVLDEHLAAAYEEIEAKFAVTEDDDEI